MTLDELSVVIRPPDPEVTLDHFTTHVTEHLHWLTKNVEATYSPASTSRDLRPLERGYWLLSPSSWDTQLQIDFWRFLQQMVGKGNAGWGVWCCREPAVDGLSLGTVRVFCWGEVVQHVYLMLYVASKSKVRKLGLQWIDAEEVVVVQMRLA